MAETAEEKTEREFKEWRQRTYGDREDLDKAILADNAPRGGYIPNSKKGRG